MTFSKQTVKSKPVVGKLLTDTTDHTKFTVKTFYDNNGVQRTAYLLPVALG